MDKKWYLSKTLWANALLGLATIIQQVTGYKLDAEAQAAIIVVVNVIMRLITKQGLTK